MTTRFTKIPRYQTVDVRFGNKQAAGYGNGPVITYRLSDEELEKIRKETGWMPAITKEQYFDLKAQGKSDAQICKEFGIDSNKLYALKKQWNAIGKFRGGKKVDVQPEEKENKANIASSIEANVTMDEVIDPIHVEKAALDIAATTDENAAMNLAKQILELLGQTNVKTTVLLENPVLKEIFGLFIGQTKKGIEKYGTTVNPIDFSLSEWIDHVLQEKIDEIVYLVTLKHKIKSIL